MINVIAVGKIKEKSLQSLINEYDKRMKSVHPLNMIEIANSKLNEKNIDAIILDESQRILAKIKPNDYVILLDLKGKDFSSEILSQQIIQTLDNGSNISFVIGGSHGVSQEIRNRANKMWKISNLTFPHQVVRLLLYEQVYRSFMIARNHPYHK